jgi:hypothetical protein
MKKKSPSKKTTTLNQAQLFRNVVAARTQFLRYLDDCRKSLEEEFGHKTVLGISDYQTKFDRGDIADRIVRLYPDECFKSPPDIYETEDEEETEFEKAWNELNDEHRLTSLILRADVLSGVGRFGIILLGIDDKKPLEEPVDAVLRDLNERMKRTARDIVQDDEDEDESEDEGERPTAMHRLLYIRAFSEGTVLIKAYDSDMNSPRFGQPDMYEINMAKEGLDPSGNITPFTSGIKQKTPAGQIGTTLKVHWTRVIHLADNRLSDDIFGVPRLQKVFDRVFGLHKIAGSSPEMFYKGAFSGLSLETQMDKDGGTPTIDKEATADELEKYYAGLQRYLALEGMTAKSLAPQVSDPTASAELQIKLICITLQCPWRVFVGAEVGQLASGQDIVAWNERLAKRREEYVSPYVIRPLLDRLIVMGILPFPSGGKDDPRPDNGKPKYIVWWPSLHSPSPEEKASVAEKRTNAIAKYAAGGCDQVIAVPHFLEYIIGFTKDETDAIIEEVGDRIMETDPEAEREQQQDDAEIGHERELERIEVEAKLKPKPAAKPPAFSRNKKKGRKKK